MRKRVAIPTIVSVGASGPQYQTPAYANAGGTGDRRASITVTTNLSIGGGVINLCLDGVTAGDVMFLNSQAVAGKYFRFDFGAAKKITEAKLYASNTASDTTAWKWQGSNDATNWVDVSASQGIVGVSATPRTLTIDSTGYRYIQFIGISGTTIFFCREFEFKIGSLLP